MSRSATTTTTTERVGELLTLFRLTTAAQSMASRLLEQGHSPALELVCEVLEEERDARWERRVERNRKASKLPARKRLEAFDTLRLPPKAGMHLHELTRGNFLDRAVNVLCFGLPGTGKSHAAVGLGHALIEAGRTVLFAPTYRLVQQLLVAKRDLELPRLLKKLDNFDLIILDDLGYVQQTQDEAEVLFTLMAERYERRSLLITSNLVFSEWQQVFRNKMTTAAAIDRLVHHSVILEFGAESYRTTEAEAKQQADREPA